MSKLWYNNDKDYMILEEDLTLEQFHEQALRNIILAGYEYYDRSMTRKLNEFPSYAEVYSYYMKNKENKSEKEIVDHLNKVYSMGTDAVKLFPYKESTELYDRATSIGIMTETNPIILSIITNQKMVDFGNSQMELYLAVMELSFLLKKATHKKVILQLDHNKSLK